MKGARELRKDAEALRKKMVEEGTLGPEERKRLAVCDEAIELVELLESLEKLGFVKRKQESVR